MTLSENFFWRLTIFKSPYWANTLNQLLKIFEKNSICANYTITFPVQHLQKFILLRICRSCVVYSMLQSSPTCAFAVQSNFAFKCAILYFQHFKLFPPWGVYVLEIGIQFIHYARSRRLFVPFIKVKNRNKKKTMQKKDKIDTWYNHFIRLDN